MKKLMLSADSNVMLYEVSDKIIDDFENILDNFYAWKKTNCYDEQLFVQYIQQVFGEKTIKFIEDLGCDYDKIAKEHLDIKWYNF